jgi:protein-tyrosine-phosphatase
MTEPNESSAAHPEPTTYNLLFVCTGNTCRSPMAAAIAEAAVRERGWTHVSVASAGVAAGFASEASPLALDVVREHGLDLSAHRSQQLSADIVEWADLILVMSPSHLFSVSDMGGGEKVALLTDFVEGDGLGEPIEDPFGSDYEAYERAYEQIERAIGGVLARLEPILAP